MAAAWCGILAGNGEGLLIVSNIMWVSNQLQAFVVHRVLCQQLDYCAICCVGT